METQKEKKFRLSLNKINKILNAEAHGAFNADDAAAFVSEYTQLVGQINPQEFTLDFDSTNLKVSSVDMVPLLTACLEMYKKDNFKKINFHCSTNATLKMQIRRLSNNVGLQNFEIV